MDRAERAKRYYENDYAKTQRAGIQGWGNSLVDRLVERGPARQADERILEIGASSGEHLAFVSPEPPWREYVALDLRPGSTNPRLAQQLTEAGVTFVTAPASEIPFDDAYFDRSISTCVLAHVDDPEAVFSELRRVTRPGGAITIGMPCDPGLLNRFVKTVVTYPAMRRAGIEDPRLQYAREHVNGIGNLLALAKHVYRDDDVRVSYFPLPIPSWNVNLVATVRVRKASSRSA